MRGTNEYPTCNGREDVDRQTIERLRTDAEREQRIRVGPASGGRTGDCSSKKHGSAFRASIICRETGYSFLARGCGSIPH